MEKCYNSALVMPNSYVVMNEDEMMYIEGGALKISQLAEMIDLAFLAAGGAIANVIDLCDGVLMVIYLGDKYAY